MVAAGLGDRAPTVAHRLPGGPQQPTGDPGPGRDLRQRLSERGGWAVTAPAVPAPLGPHQNTLAGTDIQIAGKCCGPTLRALRGCLAGRADRHHVGIGDGVHDADTILVVFDLGDGEANDALKP